VRGRVAIAASGCADGGAWVGTVENWSVALSGVVDLVAGSEVVRDPAASIAGHLAKTGVSGLADLLGDFVVVATDGEHLYAARDHLGSDGLFVSTSGSVGVVASEPKQVVAALGRARRPDLDAIVAVYFSQWEAKDDIPSVVEGVDRVPRAAIVEVEPGGWRRVGRVWHPEPLLETSALTVGEAEEAVWATVTAAVGRGVTDHTAIGLSGGIDSTLIAAAAAEGYPAGLGAVSAVYPHAPSVDESRYIRATAEYLGLELTTYQPSRPRLDSLQQWVDLIDGPTHGLSLGAVAEMNDVARGAGYTTLLGGEMAELVYDLREHALSRMLWRGRFGTVLRQVRSWHARGADLTSITRSLVSGLVPPSVGLAYARRFRTASDPAPWLDRSFMPGLERQWALERPARRRWPDIQLFFATGPSYPGLEIATIMGDVAGVRTRRPLVDRQVWELFLSLPPEVKFPSFETKSLVRRVLDGRAPQEVVWRSDKTVFDQDARVRSETGYLVQRLNDGFELPGVQYSLLLDRFESGEMTTWELSMARTLASIHAFIEVCS
jgi:asparagine synthase (glutamine-hydrolysing)